MRISTPELINMFVPRKHEGVSSFLCLTTTAITSSVDIVPEYEAETENRFVDIHSLNMLGEYVGYLIVPKRGRVRNLHSHLAVTTSQFDRLPLKSKATQGGHFEIMFRLDGLRVYQYGPDGLFLSVPQSNRITEILE